MWGSVPIRSNAVTKYTPQVLIYWNVGKNYARMHVDYSFIRFVMAKSRIHKNRRAACALMSLINWVFLATTAYARTYTHIVAFGDSLTDHHGLEFYLAPYVGVYDPETNPGGVLEVRSNGDGWVEYLADGWDETLENNAIAGAMTQGHENEDIQSYIDLGSLPQQR